MCCDLGLHVHVHHVRVRVRTVQVNYVYDKCGIMVLHM